jgi:glycosyltransferase involved in cell wall biosynthesis
MKVEILKYKIRKKVYKFFEKFIDKINLTKLYKPINAEILILDDFFPCPLSNFRFIEFNEYLQKYNSVALTTGKSLPVAQVYSSIKKYIRVHPNRDRIKIFRKDRLANAKLAVLVFQYNTEIFLDYLEKNEIPFIFTLYPGGNLKLNDKQGDIGLKRIFNSRYFRKVIVTQKITYDYLLENRFCEPENIEFIYGCPIETNKQIVLSKHFESEKKEINICFVAAKYHPTGMDKGYDIFIETAKELCFSSDIYKFHVVGGFNKDDIDINTIKNNIQFYGYLEINALRHFYENMDIILSPNRSNILASGAFDGFPTAAVVEAGLKGVIMMLTDDKKQNIFLEDKRDCIFINHNANDIAKMIIDLSNDTYLMNIISCSGQNKLSNLFSYNTQIIKRFNIIDSLI